MERESLFFELKHKSEFTDIAMTKKNLRNYKRIAAYLVQRGVAKDDVASVACRSPSLRLLYIQV